MQYTRGQTERPRAPLLQLNNNPDVKTMIMFWFSGYYTGRNYETSSYPAKPDPELVYIATVNYCDKNSQNDTVDLADFLYSSLL